MAFALSRPTFVVSALHNTYLHILKTHLNESNVAETYAGETQIQVMYIENGFDINYTYNCLPLQYGILVMEFVHRVEVQLKIHYF